MEVDDVWSSVTDPVTELLYIVDGVDGPERKVRFLQGCERFDFVAAAKVRVNIDARRPEVLDLQVHDLILARW